MMSAAGFVMFVVLIPVFVVPFSSPLPIDDAEALLSFKKSLSNAGPLFTWKQGTQPCKDRWLGVFCTKEKDVVIRIHLPRMGLSGTIDVKSLSKIQTLRTLSLVNNSFTGPLPSFNSMNNVKALYLSGNNFSGEISNDFFTGMGSLSRVWLPNNNFTGNIPGSLAKLPHLNQLHLENNQFSGGIPDLPQNSLSNLDLSNNKLDGRIPDSIARFGGKAFAGNSGVCGKAVGLECKLPPKVKEWPKHGSGGGLMTTIDLMVCIVVVMVFLLLINTGFKHKGKEENDLSMFGKERNYNAQQEVVVVCPTKDQNDLACGHKKKLEVNVSKKGVADLVVVNEEKGTFGFADLMKAAAEVLGNAGLGSAYKAVMGNGFSVVVKRIKNMNTLGKEEFDAELRGIAKIRHPNILTPLAYHYRKEEKLVISEYVSKGSLLYVMHGDRGASHDELNWAMRLNIIKGIARGMKFLHEQFGLIGLPHGNLKSSNVLLNENYEPLINDYGFLPFLSVREATQGMFAFKTPEALKTKQVSPQSDVYCFGIIIIEVLTGKFPSQYISGGKVGTDVIEWVQSAIQEGKEAQLLDPEIASSSSLESIKNMVQLLLLGARCTETDPQQRPTMEDIMKRIEEIEVHVID